VKKTLILSLFALMMPAGPAALAHDMWATADQPQPGKPLTAVIGYGHNFPQFEVIPDEEASLFKPLRVIGPKGELTMKAGSPNYAWVSSEPAAAGSYLVVADVAPVFWSKTPSGWVMKPKNEAEGGLECGHYLENAKGVVKIGSGDGAAAVGKPVGLPIEIVPQLDPAAVKSGQKLPLLVLFQGRPLAGAKVEGRFAGFAQMASPGAVAFADTTDQEGVVKFVPLRAGDWILTVRKEMPFADPEPVR
jgi:uncharacterized GH25 family protein